MKADIKHEVNLSGTWYSALVEEVLDDNNAVFLVVGDGGAIERHKCSRGVESGNFRSKH